MDRKNQVLKCINLKKGQGLELGPLYSPVVLKEEAKIEYVDHMSTSELRSKYEGHPFSVEDIVDVDYVVGGSSLVKELKGKKVDFIIASHVIEHLPDIVGWLKDISEILKPGGILSLVIPDKRYSFDITRKESTPSEVIGNHLDRLDKASSAMIYDSAVEYRNISPSKAWEYSGKRPFPEPSSWSTGEAMRRSLLSLDPKEYVDSHCYVFTPYTFFKILKRLIEHDMLDYEVAYFKDTSMNELEFYVSLRKVSKRTNKKNQLASLPKIKRPLTEKELEYRLNQLSTELNEMVNSKSWRLTSPLRKAIAKINRK